jgi:hypothetical protein
MLGKQWGKSVAIKLPRRATAAGMPKKASKGRFY